MARLEYLNDTLYVSRAELLEVAEDIIARGEYALLICPPRSGLTTFLTMLQQRLQSSYPMCITLDLVEDTDAFSTLPDEIARSIHISAGAEVTKTRSRYSSIRST